MFMQEGCQRETENSIIDNNAVELFILLFQPFMRGLKINRIFWKAVNA